MASRRLGKLLRDLERHRHALDFDRDGLGDAMLDASIEVIIRDFNQQRSPDGSPWRPLSAAYLEFKRRYAGTEQMGVLSGVMAGDDHNFKGERFVSATEARAAFGDSEEAREHADFFSRDRPFYALNFESIDRGMRLVDKRFRKMV